MGCPWLGGQQTHELHPACPGPCSVLPLCSAASSLPRGKERKCPSHEACILFISLLSVSPYKSVSSMRESLHSYLLAATRNSYKLRGLKQHKFILQLWRSEVRLQAAFFSGGSRRESVSWPFPASTGRPHSLAPGLPSSKPARPSLRSPPRYHVSSLTPPLLPPSST